MSLEKPSKESSRRDFLRQALVAAGIVVATGVGANFIPDAESKKIATQETPKAKKIEPAEPYDQEAFLKFEKDPRTYDMGELAGTKCGGLFAEYSIGETRRVRPQEDIDFRYQIAALWRKKLDLVDKKDVGMYPAIIEEAREMFCNYDPSRIHRTTLNDYRGDVDRAIAEVREHADLDKIRTIGAFAHFGESQMALLKALEKQIGADELIAYSLTELMPTGEGSAREGVLFLDFLLRNAGSEFFDLVPSYDSWISSGAYQLTGGAVNELGNEKAGASRIQQAVLAPNMHEIPKSVVELRGAQQHKAAYLFAIDNLALAIRNLGERKSKKFLELSSQWPGGLVVEYIACAHHEPVEARQAFEAFVDHFIASNEAPRSHGHKYPIRPFSDFCADKPHIGEYCVKTKSNVAGLKEWMSS